MKFAADENFNNRILRGLRRLYPNLDVLRIQDSEVFGMDDPAVLEWCALEQRILLTHDFLTIPMFAFARVQAGLHFSGVILVSASLPIGETIDELVVQIECANQEDWTDRLVYLPL